MDILACITCAFKNTLAGMFGDMRRNALRLLTPYALRVTALILCAEIPVCQQRILMQFIPLHHMPQRALRKGAADDAGINFH